MRRLMTLLFLVMICSLQLTTSAPFASDVANSKCCLTFSKAKIPLKLVKSYYWTSSSCPIRAIVFQTQKREICVDPETTWVTGHITQVDKRTTTAKTRTTTI